MAFNDATEREAVQALAYDIMDLSTVCAALATTVKGKMATTIRTQSKAAADSSGVRPAIFYVPTQGEETIWMGPAIDQHVQDGRYVIIVLITDGGASTVRASTGLSVEDFTAARDREMIAALARYGILEGQIFPEHLFDGRLNRARASDIAAKWMSLFPGGSHKTMSWLSNNAQDAAMGYGLFDVWNNPNLRGVDGINARSADCRFYVRREQWQAIAGNTNINPFYQTGGTRTQDALAEYSRNDPSIGRYAISQRTEPQGYAAAATDNRVLVHTPPNVGNA